MKTMRATLLYLAAGLLGGFALSAWFTDQGPDSPAVSPPQRESLEPRIARLEAQLSVVIAENAELRATVERFETLMAAEPAAPQTAAEPGSDAPLAAEVPAEAFRTRSREGSRAGRFGDERDLIARLTEAGFSAADAQHIETRIEELRVAAMQSRYEALRSGTPQNAGDPPRNGAAALRAELGDADYERYLEATGRPTRVSVTNVLASSAAETAGILPGDQILSYAGQRVFDLRELNQVLLEGDPGESVIVDIERDGQPMQVVIPRGPLGISSGFRGPRR